MLNRITVQLPVEGLLFWKLSGREAMSESFALTLTLLGTDARIDRSKLLGQPVTVTIPTQNLLTPLYQRQGDARGGERRGADGHPLRGVPADGGAGPVADEARP